MEPEPRPIRRSLFAVWRRPWWVWALILPIAFTMYGFSSGVVFYFLHKHNITGPVYTACQIIYWPVDRLRYNWDIGDAIGQWWWETLKRTFDPDN